MPTPMTHALVGASFSTALTERLRGFRAAVVLGFLAAMPDLDIVGNRTLRGSIPPSPLTAEPHAGFHS